MSTTTPPVSNAGDSPSAGATLSEKLRALRDQGSAPQSTPAPAQTPAARIETAVEQKARPEVAARQRLPSRRVAETFELEVGGLRYTATIGRFPDGRIGELFLNNHKSNSATDVNAGDAAIVCSIAIQFGADIEIIRQALCRDSQGRASGPLGAALDRIAAESAP